MLVLVLGARKVPPLICLDLIQGCLIWSSGELPLGQAPWAMLKPLSWSSTDGGRIIGISDRDPFDQNYSRESAENGFGHEAGACESRQGMALPFVKLGLALVMALALFGSLYWSISISTLSQVHIYRGYRHLQELLVSDLSEIS